MVKLSVDGLDVGGKQAVSSMEARGILDDFGLRLRENGALACEVLGQSRDAHVIKARARVIIWLKDELGWGWTAIAKLLSKDPSTVKHAYSVASKSQLASKSQEAA